MRGPAARDGVTTIEPWDYRYYAEKVRKAKYDLDQNAVTPYLQLEKIREAVFYTAGRLFGLAFTPVTGILTVTPDVGILDAAQMMGERNLRHLPVVEGGNLVGIVSIKDVLGFLAERLWSEKDAVAHDTARALLSQDS